MNTDPSSASTEFYIVLGHAPRYLDRNLSVFGRVLEGMAHLQALPRGGGANGIVQNPDARSRILSLRVGDDLPEAERPALEVLRTDGEAFQGVIQRRTRRTEEFFVFSPDYVDVCGVPIPVRRADRG